ncbi:DNA-binding transcriptional regulator, LysR family [Mesorhizobium albiziae]|uniref:DNA-binding transcriptional regulator, LysR family n=1 Tax=Neomesorhizobium albiziae TaxID=335020 RepID=A0A1I4EUV0_9HYPH|nr:LysR family transcriptional regulator [Mesorhizobium albiziae]GLS32662.1 LysR family transcriptional regulator [Mesorhizobium albiziae]SFL08983.1 DNA-binding transcriptional regulator, LysR family [Mesorhizobium albiziae]
MDLNAVQMFVSVVQAGSLSAAAHRTGIPLPTLSRRIRELERELKVQLLERSAKGTRLTDTGTRLYEHATRGIEALVEAEQAVISDQAHLRGRLRLSLPTAFEPWWELLGAFQLRYPGIQLSVYTTDRRVDLIQDGIDVALRIGAIVHEAMVARRLLTYRHALVASPDLLARLGTPGSPEALYHLPCAMWCPDANTQPRWRLGEHIVEPKAMLTTNDYLQLCGRALAGEVITELPRFLAVDHIQTGMLCEVLPDHPLPEQQVSLLYPSHRNPSSIVRAYLDFCQKQMAKFLRL